MKKDHLTQKAIYAFILVVLVALVGSGSGAVGAWLCVSQAVIGEAPADVRSELDDVQSELDDAQSELERAGREIAELKKQLSAVKDEVEKAAALTNKQDILAKAISMTNKSVCTLWAWQWGSSAPSLMKVKERTGEIATLLGEPAPIPDPD